ncbi:MAG TPA: arsenite methyltransferase [Thermoanaerobaculia bacterium]|jgi:SAM-dependent methyltransferase|nr:arsenite methyltransferase [Thermoanaerobaculia bacterium]
MNIETVTPTAEATISPCCGPTCCGGTIADTAEANVPADRAAIQAAVRAKYDSVAKAVAAGKSGASAIGCCGGDSCADPITSDLYTEAETLGLPKDAILASLGCGNPTALAELLPGEVVLDLGSGGGIDVLLSARRVGPTGKAYGLDQSDEMLALARQNQRQAGAANVEFLRGAIENVPLPSDTADVIISNCVINLSGDKRKALAEAFRVLKPGGRLAISDVVFLGAVPTDLKKSVELWAGCVAGALESDEYRTLLAEVGFEAIDIEPTRVYRAEEAKAFLAGTQLDPLAGGLDEIDGKAAAAFVRARKPVIEG